MKAINYLGMFLGLTAYLSISYFYDWKLAALTSACIWSNNLERKGRP